MDDGSENRTSRNKLTLNASISVGNDNMHSNKILPTLLNMENTVDSPIIERTLENTIQDGSLRIPDIGDQVNIELNDVIKVKDNESNKSGRNGIRSPSPLI